MAEPSIPEQARAESLSIKWLCITHMGACWLLMFAALFTINRSLYQGFWSLAGMGVGLLLHFGQESLMARAKDYTDRLDAIAGDRSE